MGRYFGAIALAALALAACATQPTSAPDTALVAAPKQVFVTRHLQKGEGDDPSLTAEGAANAQRLATMLAGKGIVAIYATPARRAIETAQPLATRLGIPVTPYDPRNPEALARAVADAPGPVLVVGHSNTVPRLIERFGGGPQPAMSEDEFGTLFIIDPDGTVAQTQVR